MASVFSVTALKFCFKESIRCKYIYKAFRGLTLMRSISFLSDSAELCGYRMTHTGSSYLAAPKLEATPEKVFEDIIDCAVSDLNNRKLHDIAQWIKKALHYNVPHGKRSRQAAMRQSFRSMVPKEDLTSQNLYLAEILGWCIEICQASFLIEDDIMDKSITRRGRLCWYKMEEVGLLAVLDGILLEKLIFLTLKKYFSRHPSYVDFFETFNHAIWLTLTGQTIDMLSTPDSSKPDLTKFSRDRYYSIVNSKTAYYSFVLPVKAAVLLANKKDSYTESVEDILMKMGEYFQIQDDALDCFGDPKIMGKVGTDIEGGKCCWPIVTALERVSPEQYSLLQENYGVHDEKCVRRVKEIYNNLGILQLFVEYEKEIYSTLCNEIEILPSKCEIPRAVFYDMLNIIHKRNA